MADKNTYSAIDAFLDEREPNFKDLGLSEATKSGEELLNRTHEFADSDLLSDLVKGVSKKTSPKAKDATLQTRMHEKEAATPRMGSAWTAQTRTSGGGEDDDSLLGEITESFEAAERGATVEKKSISDAEVTRHIHDLLNQGMSPAKVAAKLKKLAEVDSFNQQLAAAYLKKNAGLLGTAYLEPNTAVKTADLELFQHSMGNEYLKNSDSGGTGMENLQPNTFMDKQNPNYNHNAGVDLPKHKCPDCGTIVRTYKGADDTEEKRDYRLTSHDVNGKECKGTNKKTASWEDGKTNEDCPLSERERCNTSDKDTCCGGGAGASCSCKDCHPPVIGQDSEHGKFLKDKFNQVSSKNAKENPSKISFDEKGKVTPWDLYHAGKRPTAPEILKAYQPWREQAKAECLAHGYTPGTKEWDEVYERTLSFYALMGGPGFIVASTKQEASSNDCVRQATSWKSAGITPKAKSVKQITACDGCSYFKQNASTKTCGLYQLPVVGSKTELTKIVNRMTAGVPTNSKKAALVQIANEGGQHASAVKIGTSPVQSAPFVHQASFTHERASNGLPEAQHFSGAHIQKLHTAGHSLKTITAAAEKKFGLLETSKAVREFIASLSKEKGKIIMAQTDADYLKKIGIHNEAIVGALKCASCTAHTSKEVHKAASTEKVTRVASEFVESTLATLRSNQTRIVSKFDSESVNKLHLAGHSLDKIYKAATAKVGSVQTSKAIRDWAKNLKNTNTKIALSQVDCTVLQKMGVKLSFKNAIVGEAKCGSCNYRNGMHCGLTGGTLVSFPGMNQIASNKKVGAGAPEDGRSMLQEFDLMGKTAQADIDMSAPDRAEVHMASTMNAGTIGATYPKYEVNGRACTSYEDANLYWTEYGGILMEKLDSMTPWHMLRNSEEK